MIFIHEVRTAVSRCPVALVTLILFCSGLSAWASAPNESAPLITEADLFGDIPLVSSATRLVQKRSEAPASITLIDREMIEASGALEISDLFRLVPGFQAYHVNAHVFGVTSHGLGSSHPRRLEVMIDGRSVYMPLLSTLDWRALGIGVNDIDSIEVVRGSNVPAYGSNAFLGAINIITRQPMKDPGTRVRTVLGAERTAKVELSHGGSLGRNTVRLAAGFQTSDGFDGVDDDGRAKYFNFHSSYTPSLTDSIDLQLGYSRGEAGVGPSFSRIFNREFDAGYQSLVWTRELERDGELRLQFYHHDYRINIEETRISELFGIAPPALSALGIPDELIPRTPEDGTTERYDLELQHQVRLGPEVRALWGAGVHLDQAQSEALLNSDQTIDETLWRLFGNLEWRPAERLSWNLGAMLEHNDLVGTKVSPRLALNYQLHRRHSLRASYTLAYRTPSLLEAHRDSRVTHSNGTLLLWLRNSDPELRAEEVRTLELGYLGQIPELELEIDLKLFREQVDHGIGRVTNAHSEPVLFGSLFERTTTTNNSAWRAQGLETQLKIRPGERTWLALQYAYLDIDGQSRGGDLDAGDSSPSPFVPRHTLSLLASHGLGSGWDASLGLYRQSATRFVGGSDIEAYNRLDLRLARQFSRGRTEGQAALLVQNLLEDYNEFQHRNLFDTRAFLTLSLHFL